MATVTQIAHEVVMANPDERAAILEARVRALPAEEQQLAYGWFTAQGAAIAGGREVNNRTDKWVLFGSACLFLIGFLAIALLIPNPTPFQRETFRIVLSLAAAAFAQAIPGVLRVGVTSGGTGVDWKIRAGGALAVFVIIYFLNPAGGNVAPVGK